MKLHDLLDLASGVDAFDPHLRRNNQKWVGALQHRPISVEMLIGVFVPRLIIFRFGGRGSMPGPLPNGMGVEMTLSSTNQNWSNYGFAKLSLR